jgi:hypothetical protein
MRIVEPAGSFGDRVQDPPAQGARRSDGWRDHGSASNDSKAGSNNLNSFWGGSTPERGTHGELHPATACVGKKAFMAKSTSHDIAVKLSQRQRETRVIAICRSEDPKTVEIGRSAETCRHEPQPNCRSALHSIFQI